MMLRYFIWKKGENPLLTKNFRASEFECPGPPGQEFRISVCLLNKLQLIRDEINIPLTITSGYRTDSYNQELTSQGYKTAKNSQHLLGNAVDITCRDMEKLFELCEKHFDAIGIASSFIHVDMRQDKKRRWEY